MNRVKAAAAFVELELERGKYDRQMRAAHGEAAKLGLTLKRMAIPAAAVSATFFGMSKALGAFVNAASRLQEQQNAFKAVFKAQSAEAAKFAKILSRDTGGALDDAHRKH